MDRGTWVSTVFDQTYVWPRGTVVYVYGAVEYVRRMAGEITDAQPHRAVNVTSFTSFEAFREWCRADGQSRRAPPAPPLPHSKTQISRPTGTSEPHEID